MRSCRASAGLAIAALVFGSGMLIGQTTFGLIEGRVTDSTGRALQGATVTVTSIRTGDQRSVSTNGEGLYRALDLKPGDYDVRVDLPQFASVLRPGVSLNVSETLDIPFRLELATVAQTVTVTTEAPTINADTAEIGQVIESRRVLDLPVNGRDFTRLALFAPGAKIYTSGMANMTFNGTNNEQNNYLLDGTDATWVHASYLPNGLERGARLLTASSESVEEFRVLTSNYSAEYGRAAGAVVSVITKSGGNKFHGSGYYFLRNENLDARNFFDPADKPLFHLNQFGASLGGPIRRNRLFFFGNYEGSRKNLGATQTGSVPSAAFRATVAPALATILAVIPLPTQATADPNVGIARVTGVTAITENVYSTRIDYKVSDKDGIFGRFNIQDSLINGPLFVLHSNQFAGQNQNVNADYGTGTVSYTHTFRPNLMNEFKLGINHTYTKTASTDANIRAASLDTAAGRLYPSLTITGVDIRVGGLENTHQTSLGYEFIDNLMWYSGKHTVKAGINIRRKQTEPYKEGFPKVSFKSLADFAADKVQSATVTGDGGPGLMYGWEYSGFLQDSIKATQRLTLNLGVRYDYTTPFWPASGTKIANFDLTTLSQVTQSPFYTTRRDLLSPRIGVTYDLRGDGRIVLGGGYGIYYNPYVQLQDFYTAVLYSNITPSTTFTQTTNPGLQFPLPSLAGGTVAPPNETAIDPKWRPNYTQQFTFNVQQQLGSDMSLQIGYVGSRSYNALITKPGNLISPATGQRTYPQFSQFSIMTENGHSEYDALQILFNRRFSHGLAFNATYTFSGFWDNIQSDISTSSSGGTPEIPCANDRDFASCPGLQNEYGRSDLDTPHNLSFNTIWQLPLGRGRWREGWQWNGIVLARSGFPYSVYLGTGEVNNGWFGSQRPNLVLGVPTTGNIQGPAGWLNPAAFSVPAAGQYGNLGRNTEWGPSFVQFDTSVFKNFMIRENHRIQVRAEAFNILNHTNWAISPAAVLLTPASFGQILNTFGRTESYGTSRQIQFAVRYDF